MKNLFFLFLVVIASPTYGQNLTLRGTTTAFDLVPGTDLYEEFAIARIKQVSTPYRLDFTSSNGGFLLNGPYQLPYGLYFSDQKSCKDKTCARQITLPMGSLFSPFSGDQGSLLIEIMGADIQAAAGGVYTETITVDVIII